jgi:phosphatidate cytidylyltransferase
MRKRHHKAKARSFSDVDDIDDDDDCNIDGDSVPSTTKEPVTFKKVMTRTITAVILTGFYLCMLQAGHFYCILVGVLTQAELYRELVNVRYVEAKERKMPWFRTLQWAWFVVPMFFVYGETLHKFCTEHYQLKQLTAFTQHIGYIVFILYCTLFILTVLTLKQGLLRFQIGQLLWSIVTVCLVVFQTKFFAANTLNGLFWFFFPMATVVMNDVSAYFCGITMGKRFIQTPLNSMSPNKTWEGFVGAAVLTLIFSFYFPVLLAQFTWFTCPAEGLFFWPFPPPLVCEPNAVFQTAELTLPLLGKVSMLPIQLHGLSYGLFASLVAPFGGFFASAIKRAYKKKDFDSFMPGRQAGNYIHDLRIVTLQCLDYYLMKEMGCIISAALVF